MKLVPMLAATLALAGCSMMPGAPGAAGKADIAAAREQVMATERAFARTMADRNLQAFSSFLSEEAVFFSGPTPLRGKAAVTAFWQRFYNTPQAPFSWEPDEVEVLDSGTLALSSGPVKNPEGVIFARFTSIWRLEAPGQWRIVFDRGNPVAPAKP
ncbi:nuclear transport factor 2 family protein [Ramlibacter sp. XY19]|uniref:YybH family protein n=1 Tax=Ramlibacter paludis TaxID=2908000 RepID=UPI0023DC71F6|nr:nuclear transport factor 2 family protein [Ramlibacter paludis]MCG2595390.1 nuclear transport factor 2 family protein [Ramlibacter paludis]